MKPLIYTDVDLLIKESTRHIIINPKGERFYFVECEDQYLIYRNATLTYNPDEERYEIRGDQSLYSEHKDVGFSYEKLLCLHPAELIKRKSFFGVVWYSVSGILKRDVQSRYLCQHNAYTIEERTSFLSHSIEDI
ncbi:hypothetical protein [Sulfuricurvum sp.]|uniref:hypothetical protein n=1 Tax=Sulfuricurvum sp. TaxID=2025608 RepID=UPI002D56C223|nr:hypothetical protein [Sulfuricurvum sp.]HZF69393.1 hypothetical protein [Sulfuricurvum sp.]